MNAMSPTLEPGAATPWQLGRIEIRSKISHREEVIARVELIHAERGRLTEIASGEGGVEAGFTAIGRIVGVGAVLERLSVTTVPASGPSAGGSQTSACVAVRYRGFFASGSAVSSDMLSACLCAYLQALLAAQTLAAGRRQPPA